MRGGTATKVSAVAAVMDTLLGAMRAWRRLHVGPGRHEALLLVLWCAALVAGCAAPVTHATTPAAPQATSLPTPVPTWTTLPMIALPAFADWRAAYAGTDGLLHAVTFDGKTDLAGQPLPGLSSYGLMLVSAGASPNGKLVAYAATGLNIVDAAQVTPVSSAGMAAAYTMFWSPDGTRLALGDNEGRFAIADAGAGRTTPVPGSRPALFRTLDGWLDNTHVLIDGVSTGGNSIVLGALNIADGRVRQIAALPLERNVEYRISLAPDGHEVLVYGWPYRDYLYTPFADLVDTTTGAHRLLPALAARTPQGVGEVVWRPDSLALAFSLNQQGAPAMILSLATGAATALTTAPADETVAAWSPDGSTLIFSTGYQLGVGTGPFTVSAVSLTSGALPRVTVLTNDAMSFPFIGFVRTA
ncbi:MAG: hypothetical protein ACHQ4H_10570 [Ktedonobacterales bacterium]